MKKILTLVALSAVLASCQDDPSATLDSSSLTHFHPAAQGKLVKSPIGSIFTNHYSNDQGLDVYETYQVQSDHSVKLIRRAAVPGNS